MPSPARSFKTIGSATPRTALGLAAALALAGCISHQTASSPRDRSLDEGQVAVIGPRVSERSLAAIDVLNPRGSIRVIVDNELRNAEVRASVRRNGRSERDVASLNEQLKYSAVSSIVGGRVKLTVRPTSVPIGEFIDVEIRVPSAASVYARNAGGLTELVGVSGEINVQSGSDRLLGGDVLVRTEQPVPGPVRIATSDGSVRMFLGPAASGDLDLTTSDGSVGVVSMASPVRDARPDPLRYTGVLGSGENEFFVTTRRGDIRINIGDANWEQGTNFDWLQNPIYGMP